MCYAVLFYRRLSYLYNGPRLRITANGFLVLRILCCANLRPCVFVLLHPVVFYTVRLIVCHAVLVDRVLRELRRWWG